MLYVATFLFPSRRSSPRQDEEIYGRANCYDGLVRPLWIRSEHVLGRLQDRKPSAGAKVKIVVCERDSRAGIFRRTQPVFDHEVALLFVLPGRFESHTK